MNPVECSQSFKEKKMKTQPFTSYASPIDVLEKTPEIQTRQTPGDTKSPLCLVKDLIWQGQTIQIEAESGGTWIACDIAQGIAGGKKLLSRFQCLSPTGVLFLQGGMPHAHILDRIVRLTDGNNVCPIKVISSEHFTSDDRPDLCDEVFQDEMFSWLADSNVYRVLILDGVSDLLPDKVEPKQIARLITLFRSNSLTVISVKSKGEGSIPIPWSKTDTILNVKALDGFDDLIIRCSFEKARNLKRDQQKTFFIKLEELDGGKVAFTECVLDEFLKAKTVQLLLNNWTQTKIASETGKDQSTISRWISNSIIPNSLLVKDGRKYLLTEAGRRMLKEHSLDSEI